MYGLLLTAALRSCSALVGPCVFASELTKAPAPALTAMREASFGESNLLEPSTPETVSAP
jgi:hypothetical protein